VARHGEVEEQDVGLQLPGQLDGFSAIASFSYHFEVWFGFQEATQSVTENRMVVGNNYASRLRSSIIHKLLPAVAGQ
jgi:hypothetical protein